MHAVTISLLLFPLFMFLYIINNNNYNNVEVLFSFVNLIYKTFNSDRYFQNYINIYE